MGFPTLRFGGLGRLLFGWQPGARNVEWTVEPLGEVFSHSHRPLTVATASETLLGMSQEEIVRAWMDGEPI